MTERRNLLKCFLMTERGREVCLSLFASPSLLFSHLLLSNESPPLRKKFKNREAVDKVITYAKQIVTEIMSCSVSKAGNTFFKKTSYGADIGASILLSEDFLAHKGDKRQYCEGSAYLGSGYYKFGVRVSIIDSFTHALLTCRFYQGMCDGEDMAFFQLIPREEGKYIGDDENEEHLKSELKALALGCDLLTKFLNLAESKNVVLPGKISSLNRPTLTDNLLYRC